MTETIYPELSDRDASQAAGQEWRSYPDGEVVGGPDLAKRLWKFGLCAGGKELLGYPVGYVIKTGVSAYERIK